MANTFLFLIWEDICYMLINFEHKMTLQVKNIPTQKRAIFDNLFQIRYSFLLKILHKYYQRQCYLPALRLPCSGSGVSFRLSACSSSGGAKGSGGRGSPPAEPGIISDNVCSEVMGWGDPSGVVESESGVAWYKKVLSLHHGCSLNKYLKMPTFQPILLIVLWMCGMSILRLFS